MNKTEALNKLRKIVGQDLFKIAKKHRITVKHPNGKVNKGWAGQAIERYLGLDLNTSTAPNLGSWELKVIPLMKKSDGTLAFKETMAITMIDKENIKKIKFEKSHLFTKLRRMIIVTRITKKNNITSSIIHSVKAVKLIKGSQLYDEVRLDYNHIQRVVIKNGFNALTGAMGKFIQPRTKGSGHGSRTRAFYARKEFLKEIIDIKK